VPPWRGQDLVAVWPAPVRPSARRGSRLGYARPGRPSRRPGRSEGKGGEGGPGEGRSDINGSSRIVVVRFDGSLAEFPPPLAGGPTSGAVDSPAGKVPSFYRIEMALRLRRALDAAAATGAGRPSQCTMASRWVARVKAT
jgi:hypothetical protein